MVGVARRRFLVTLCKTSLLSSVVSEKNIWLSNEIMCCNNNNMMMMIKGTISS